MPEIRNIKASTIPSIAKRMRPTDESLGRNTREKKLDQGAGIGSRIWVQKAKKGRNPMIRNRRAVQTEPHGYRLK